MDDECKKDDVKEVAVEDFGAGVVKLIGEGVSVVFGPNAGTGGKLIQTLGGEIASALRKVEAGIADLVKKNGAQGKSDT